MISFLPTPILWAIVFLIDLAGSILVLSFALLFAFFQMFSDAFFGLKRKFFPNQPRDDSIIIVGAGASGLALATRLKQEGFTNIRILEKHEKVGGTWLVNKYPGCACDVPAPVFQFSFYTQSFSEFRSTTSTCEDYFQSMVPKFELKKFLHLSHDVTNCSWDGSKWVVIGRDLATDEEFIFEARFLFMATGILRDPNIPLDKADFKGKAFHTAEWDSSVDLAGKTVCCIGTGASGVQTISAIAPIVKELYIFQSQPSWVFQWADVSRIERLPTSVLSLLCRFFSNIYPLRLLWRIYSFLNLELLVWSGLFLKHSALRDVYQKIVEENIRKSVKDSRLHEFLIPKIPVGSKRLLGHYDYYSNFNRKNVKLIPKRVKGFTSEGVFTDASTYPVDVVIFATGFHTFNYHVPISVVGRDGTRLRDQWARDGPAAYLATFYNNFPNMFTLYGPNSNTNHNSALFMVECQIEMVLRLMKKTGSSEILEPSQKLVQEYNVGIQNECSQKVWSKSGVNWYTNDSGRVISNWPGSCVEFWYTTSNVRLQDLQSKIKKN